MPNNQRLLISVYDAQEAREAILGGARVIDCEDPAGALGDISPRKVMTIVDAVAAYKRNLDVQISTNIGENQLLFKRDDAGRAVQRFPGEIAGKAAQAALGVAAAMDTDVHQVNIVKVGLDGMPRDIVAETLKEVVLTLDRTRNYSRSQVVSVFFAQDMEAWHERRRNPIVTRDLLLLREYFVDPKGDIDVEKSFGNDPEVMAALHEKLKDDRLLFDETGKLIPGVKVSTTQLHSRDPLGFSDDPLEYIYDVAKVTADSGADGVMIDTRIHTKVAKLCCLKHGTEALKPDAASGLKLEGIFTLDQIREYARYCHSIGLEFWASGSIQPFQAKAVWALSDDGAAGLVDAMAVRSGATEFPRALTIPKSVKVEPKTTVVNRASKRVSRDLVAPYVP